MRMCFSSPDSCASVSPDDLWEPLSLPSSFALDSLLSIAFYFSDIPNKGAQKRKKKKTNIILSSEVKPLAELYRELDSPKFPDSSILAKRGKIIFLHYCISKRGKYSPVHLEFLFWLRRSNNNNKNLLFPLPFFPP